MEHVRIYYERRQVLCAEVLNVERTHSLHIPEVGFSRQIHLHYISKFLPASEMVQVSPDVFFPLLTSYIIQLVHETKHALALFQDIYPLHTCTVKVTVVGSVCAVSQHLQHKMNVKNVWGFL